MTKIQKNILQLTLTILIIMGSFWFLTSYLTDQATKKYNQILENYLLLNNISTLSSKSHESLSTLLNDPTSKNRAKYNQEKQELLSNTKRLSEVEDEHNKIILTNYESLIKNQVEAMDLAKQFSDLGLTDTVTKYYEESLQISQFIDDTTLELFKQKLNDQKKLYKAMMELSKNLQRLGMWTLTLVLFLSLLFSYWFSKGMTKSIFELTGAVKEISAGNLDRTVQIDGKRDDEISYLGRAFDDMRLNIKRYVEELKNKAKLEKELQEHRLLLKESELSRLQNQINPHFLFNTLNMLSKKAYLEGAGETSELITSVASVLRYNLHGNDRTVLLREEIVLLEEYLTILKARFTNRIEYQIVNECHANMMKVPCFILQPIVENAFTHGIEPRERGGHIYVFIKDDVDGLRITVEDNGIGMSEERLNEIRIGKRREGQTTGGIGLSNVMKRLELHYGQKGLLKIMSEEGNGTRIEILLPNEQREDLI
ncbi:sensor histidine kinase [Falsibacillus albus]|uniref:histidine kinase n=1 Tax=Falsibacillus albus TaxID=2478915 RepID=A0A3L7K1G2_9BACI|nr:histidine kinase [Falsibacillus albus]RLQ96630.1 HAMP domain-containing protein [Falsibacillus albus]